MIETTYERWMKDEGIPMIPAYGIENVLELPRQTWSRTGGKGAYIKLAGAEGHTGLYIVEIPPGGALNAEKHLYEEIIYVLKGSGATEVQSVGTSRKNLFEWQEGSLFAMPLNTWHTLSNGSGSEPAVVLGFTNAPVILDIFHNPDFVFNNDYVFSDRYDSNASYFEVNQSRQAQQWPEPVLWCTNFVPDVRNSKLDDFEGKGTGVRMTQCEMAGGILVAHTAEWPVGRYHKAHYHGPGALLLGLKSKGFVLMWPKDLGITPFKDGHGDKVIRVDWKEGSIYSPGTGWFHQHFNTGSEPARHLALRHGSDRFRLEYRSSINREGNLISTKKGGTLIEYEDEDPIIRRMFAAECEANGVQVQMPTL